MMINILFGTFPREFGKQRVWVERKKDFYALINKYNGMIPCFTTIYSMKKYKNYLGATIDKIYFDLDKLGTCWESTKKLHSWLLDNGDLKHIILLSGGGFHVYVFVDTTYRPTHKKFAIRNAQEYIADKCNLEIGKPKEKDIDFHIIGDIARIARIPHTFNLNKQRFCIPLTEDDLTLTFEEIREKAKKQHFVKKIWGHKLLNLRDFDYVRGIKTVGYEMRDVDLKEFEVDVQPFLEKLPPVIRWLLKNCRCGWRDRYWTILAMKESGFPQRITIMLCQRFWTKEKFYHSAIEERQIQYVYNRQNLFFSFAAMEKEGYPITEEDRNFKFYGK